MAQTVESLATRAREPDAEPQATAMPSIIMIFSDRPPGSPCAAPMALQAASRNRA